MLDRLREPRIGSRLEAIAIIALAAVSIDFFADCGRGPLDQSDAAYTVLDEWYQCSSGSYPDLYGVAGHSDGSVVAVGAGGVVLESSIALSVPDMEQAAACGEWLEIGPNTTVPLRGVWQPDITTVWAAGGDGNTFNGTILRYDGATWSFPGAPSNISYNAIWGSAACDMYFFGLGISTDFPNGAHFDCSVMDDLMVDMGWSEITDVSGTSAQDIWVVMNQSTYSLWHYDGTTWGSHWETWMDQPLFGVHALPSDEVVAVGANGATYWFDGAEWTDHSIPDVDTDLYDVWGWRSMTLLGPARHIFAVGADGGVYILWGDQPGAALMMSTDVSLRAIWGVVRRMPASDTFGGEKVDADATVYFVGDDGTILMYRELIRNVPDL